MLHFAGSPVILSIGMIQNCVFFGLKEEIPSVDGQGGISSLFARFNFSKIH